MLGSPITSSWLITYCLCSVMVQYAGPGCSDFATGGPITSPNAFNRKIPRLSYWLCILSAQTEISSESVPNVELGISLPRAEPFDRGGHTVLWSGCRRGQRFV